ncbi:MAG: hypothetical protein MZU95_06185 [Desulfomicrobium escambiense]|nr:hypothetical protein [Desulfomicrobium escambiense]
MFEEGDQDSRCADELLRRNVHKINLIRTDEVKTSALLSGNQGHPLNFPCSSTGLLAWADIVLLLFESAQVVYLDQ